MALAKAAASPGDRVEFVVTLQVLADLVVPAGGARGAQPFGLAGSARAKTREALRDALAAGFDDERVATTRATDADAANDAVHPRGVLRGGRGGGAASAAAAYFKTDASRPLIVRVREDAGAVPEKKNAFFAEGAIEVVVDTLERCRACLARAFRGVARLEQAETFRSGALSDRSSETSTAKKTPPSASSPRAHVLARFDVRARRFDADDATDATPRVETRASVQVCDIAGANRDPATRTVPEDAAVKAFFRVADALCDGGATARHVPFRDSNVTKLLAGALGGGDRLRVCFGARDGVAGDASPRERQAAFEALDAALARAETTAEAFARRRSACDASGREKKRARRPRVELAEAERAAAELGFAALGEKSAEALRAGLRSTDIELDMDGPEALVALRSALARLERLRRDASKVAETREATERLFARFAS